MINFIDTSNHQGSYQVAALRGVDGIICKATEDTWFVDPYCDTVVQQCKKLGVPWGFYHFAGCNSAASEADYFVDNCLNYFGKGIPVLDWDGVYANGTLIFDQPVEWVNEFVRRVHERTGVWCWIYANPWRFDQGGVEQNCARWVADYPAVTSPTFEQAEAWVCPEVDGNVVAWQFCSDGLVAGYDGNLDCSLFYGTKEQWAKYARGPSRPDDSVSDAMPDSGSASVLENAEYKVTIERK